MHATDRMPNLRHLRAFSLTVRHRSVKRAAAEIGLSQPAVTQAIGKLEALYGESFFERSPTGMDATEFGRVFVRRVDRALAILAGAAATAADLSGSAAPSDPTWRLTAAQLRAIVSIARHGCFAVAAAELGISASAMQRTATALEHALGARLFLRVGSGIALSPAGERFARGATLAHREIETGIEEIENLRGYRIGRIVVGSMPLARVDLVPRAVTRLLRRHPDLSVRIAEGTYATLIGGLRAGEIDVVVGALRQPSPHDDITERPLFDDALSVVVRAGHPLTRHPELTLADTIGYPWIVPCPGTPTRKLFHAAFRSRALMEPKRLLEVSSNVSLRALLLDSDRVALVSHRQVAFEETHGSLVVLPVELPEAHRPIGIALRREWEPSRAQAALLAELDSVAAEDAALHQPAEPTVRRSRTGTFPGPG